MSGYQRTLFTFIGKIIGNLEITTLARQVPIQIQRTQVQRNT